ncbi:MAG: transketolase family protein [bacterium]
MKGDMVATRDAYGKALKRLGAENPNIVVLDADLAESTRTAKFGEEFPERFFDMGVAEQNMIGVAAGLASTGKIAFASTFAVFATGRVYDQIRQNLARSRLNVRIVASHGGITVGEDGPSHQMCEDIALMRVLPNMKVFMPADAIETERMIEASLKIEGPVYIRTHRAKFPTLYDEFYEFKPGKGSVLRYGKDVTVVACGLMVSEAMTAAESLAGKGISVRVVNMSSIKPLDVELLVKCARETGRILTAEEHSVIGGLGGAVAEALGEAYPVPVRRMGMKDEFGITGDWKGLLKHFGLTAAHMEETIHRWLD